MIRRLNNREWRLLNLYRIVDKNGKRQTLRPNSIQRRINADKSSRKMILKARQFGVSTNEIIKLLDHTMWTPDTTTCILAHEQDSIKKLFRIARRAYDFMPEQLKPDLDRGGGSKYEMYFPEINSRIYCDLESRGDTIQRLHVSELAFFKDPDRLKSTLQTVPLNGSVTLETTPNGIGNFFYDMWIDKNQTYSKLFFPWYLFNEYQLKDASHITSLTQDELNLITKAKRLFGIEITRNQLAFRRLKQAELKTMFIQEYPEDDQTCFLSSGEASMNLVIIKEMIDAAPEPLLDDGLVKIFKHFEKGHTYVCGADTAEGYAEDYSVGVIIDINTMEQVATIRGHLKPFEFAHALKTLCMKYTYAKVQPPLLAVERNNHGHAVLLELKEHINYPHLYIHTDDRPGWKTDLITRPIMIDSFIEAVESKNIKIKDRDILNECLTLVSLNGKIQAAEGKHDDTIIATAIALQMVIKASVLEIYKNIGSKIRV